MDKTERNYVNYVEKWNASPIIRAWNVWMVDGDGDDDCLARGDPLILCSTFADQYCGQLEVHTHALVHSPFCSLAIGISRNRTKSTMYEIYSPRARTRLNKMFFSIYVSRVCVCFFIFSVCFFFIIILILRLVTVFISDVHRVCCV